MPLILENSAFKPLHLKYTFNLFSKIKFQLDAIVKIEPIPKDTAFG